MRRFSGLGRQTAHELNDCEFQLVMEDTSSAESQAAGVVADNGVPELQRLRFRDLLWSDSTDRCFLAYFSRFLARLLL